MFCVAVAALRSAQLRGRLVRPGLATALAAPGSLMRPAALSSTALPYTYVHTLTHPPGLRPTARRDVIDGRLSSPAGGVVAVSGGITGLNARMRENCQNTTCVANEKGLLRGSVRRTRAHTYVRILLRRM